MNRNSQGQRREYAIAFHRNLRRPTGRNRKAEEAADEGYWGEVSSICSIQISVSFVYTLCDRRRQAAKAAKAAAAAAKEAQKAEWSAADQPCAPS